MPTARYSSPVRSETRKVGKVDYYYEVQLKLTSSSSRRTCSSRFDNDITNDDDKAALAAAYSLINAVRWIKPYLIKSMDDSDKDEDA